MLKKVEIKNSGDSNYLSGEIVDKIELENKNEILKKEGKNAIYHQKVEGTLFWNFRLERTFQRSNFFL